MKQIQYIIMLLLLTNCQTTTKTKNEVMNKNTPEYEIFKKQKNRFEFNGCELNYNDKPFSLGMTILEAKRIFGENNKTHTMELKNEKRLFWKNANISIIFLDKKATHIHILIKKNIYKKYGDDYNVIFQMQFQGLPSIMYNNNILYKDEKMQDFIKKSEMKFDDFFINGEGYREEKCYLNKIGIFLRSPVIYHRIGGGHLYTQGDWNLDETNPVEAITISYINN